jgi:Ca2+-binding EF-hand superfamily protein
MNSKLALSDYKQPASNGRQKEKKVNLQQEIAGLYSDEKFERDALLRVFRSLDSDGSGTLTTREVFKALSFGAAAIFPLIAPFPVLASLLTTENIAEAMKYADINNDGEVDQKEFLQLLRRLRREEEERLALLDVYTILDANRDSKVLAHEIEWALRNEKGKLMPLLNGFPELVETLSFPEKFMEAVEDADDNNDGIVSSREFCKLVKNIKMREIHKKSVKHLFNLLGGSDEQQLTQKCVCRSLILKFSKMVSILNEFPGLRACLRPANLKDSLKRADTNNDSFITFDEFLNYVDAIIEEAQEYSTLSKIFSLLDRDSSGTVDRHEVTRALQHNEKGALREFLGMFPILANVLRGKKFEVSLETADMDDNGLVDENEFIGLAIRLKLEEAERTALLTIFSILDNNDDKTLSVRELKYELKRNANAIKPLLLKHPGLYEALEPSRFIAALKRMDTNRDGKVDVKEFINFAQYLRQSSGGFKNNRFHIKVSREVVENSVNEVATNEKIESDLMEQLLQKHRMRKDMKYDIKVSKIELKNMIAEEKSQRSAGDTFFGIDLLLLQKKEKNEYKKIVLKKEMEVKERLRIESGVYNNWKKEGQQQKVNYRRERDLKMKARQSNYMSEFYKAKNTVDLFSVVKKSFVDYKPGKLDQFPTIQCYKDLDGIKKNAKKRHKSLDKPGSHNTGYSVSAHLNYSVLSPKSNYFRDMNRSRLKFYAMNQGSRGLKRQFYRKKHGIRVQLRALPSDKIKFVE